MARHSNYGRKIKNAAAMGIEDSVVSAAGGGATPSDGEATKVEVSGTITTSTGGDQPFKPRVYFGLSETDLNNNYYRNPDDPNEYWQKKSDGNVDMGNSLYPHPLKCSAYRGFVSGIGMGGRQWKCIEDDGTTSIWSDNGSSPPDTESFYLGSQEVEKANIPENSDVWKAGGSLGNYNMDLSSTSYTIQARNVSSEGTFSDWSDPVTIKHKFDLYRRNLAIQWLGTIYMTFSEMFRRGHVFNNLSQFIDFDSNGNLVKLHSTSEGPFAQYRFHDGTIASHTNHIDSFYHMERTRRTSFFDPLRMGTKSLGLGQIYTTVKQVADWDVEKIKKIVEELDIAFDTATGSQRNSSYHVKYTVGWSENFGTVASNYYTESSTTLGAGVITFSATVAGKNYTFTNKGPRQGMNSTHETSLNGMHHQSTYSDDLIPFAWAVFKETLNSYVHDGSNHNVWDKFVYNFLNTPITIVNYKYGSYSDESNYPNHISRNEKYFEKLGYKNFKLWDATTASNFGYNLDGSYKIVSNSGFLVYSSYQGLVIPAGEWEINVVGDGEMKDLSQGSGSSGELNKTVVTISSETTGDITFDGLNGNQISIGGTVYHARHGNDPNCNHMLDAGNNAGGAYTMSDLGSDGLTGWQYTYRNGYGYSQNLYSGFGSGMAERLSYFDSHDGGNVTAPGSGYGNVIHPSMMLGRELVNPTYGKIHWRQPTGNYLPTVMGCVHLRKLS